MARPDPPSSIGIRQQRGRLTEAQGQRQARRGAGCCRTCVATVTSFLFGYHTGVVNEPLDSISADIGFAGNTLAEGLVVSICLGGAFVACLFSGSVADGIGRRRAFQLSALPMIMGAALSHCFLRTPGSLLVCKGALRSGHGIPVTVDKTTYMGTNVFHAAAGLSNLLVYQCLISCWSDPTKKKGLLNACCFKCMLHCGPF
ncbi:hypothetical protein ZWY2020_058799 [Hordeum vulgare]|nr:hypothetical protein ZWY2020_058799 [Hordeum vulgare]